MLIRYNTGALATAGYGTALSHFSKGFDWNE